MALALTATPNLVSNPPSIRLDLTDPANAVTSATVLRLLPDGTSAAVRTPDGKPLTLTTSGTAKVASLDDREAPYGQPVTYVANNTAFAGPVTLDEDQAWLINPGNPERSLPIEVWEIGATRRKAAALGTFEVIGRERPIVITDGRRRSPETSITVRTRTLGQIAALDRLLADARTLLLNIPADFGWGVTREYVAIGDVEETRITEYGPQADRFWVLPYRVVDAPLGGTSSATDPGTPPPGGGGTPGTRTWGSLALEVGTWKAAAAKYPTYGAAAAG